MSQCFPKLYERSGGTEKVELDLNEGRFERSNQHQYIYPEIKNRFG